MTQELLRAPKTIIQGVLFIEVIIIIVILDIASRGICRINIHSITSLWLLNRLRQHYSVLTSHGINSCLDKVGLRVLTFLPLLVHLDQVWLSSTRATPMVHRATTKTTLVRVLRPTCITFLGLAFTLAIRLLAFVRLLFEFPIVLSLFLAVWIAFLKKRS